MLRTWNSKLICADHHECITQFRLLGHRLERLEGGATVVKDEPSMVLLVHGDEFKDGDLKRK